MKNAILHEIWILKIAILFAIWILKIAVYFAKYHNYGFRQKIIAKTEPGGKENYMNASKRQQDILIYLRNAQQPVPGAILSKQFHVSRQIIVRDISKLKEDGADIISTNRGYLLHEIPVFERVFKVKHTDEETPIELGIIIDCGGLVKDVFVYHKIYGIVRADMNLKNHRDIQRFLSDIASGKSSLLMNITSGYHYHTVIAESEEILDEIQEQLNQQGFLAKLQDYEPVNFWGIKK